jgi:hypothetical protein
MLRDTTTLGLRRRDGRGAGEGAAVTSEASGERPVLGKQLMSAAGASMTWSGRKRSVRFGACNASKRTLPRPRSVSTHSGR